MVKINQLKIENVKRVKVIEIEPTANGLTVIGGKNGQGKTSILDSIAWALGGNRYRPSEAQRQGSTIPPHLSITLDNGLIIERKGKNSDLKVTDPSGQKAGQQLLDSFVEELAINLPKFMESSAADKAKTLLQIIGVGQQLHELEQQERQLYNERLLIGRTKDQKEKYAKELPHYPDAPKDLISINDLIMQQQEILAKNGENARKRQNLTALQQQEQLLQKQITDLTNQLNMLQAQHTQVQSDIQIANKDVLTLVDESTAELEQNIANIEQINEKVRTNLNREKAEEDAKLEKEKYDNLTKEIEAVRKSQTDLLTSADLPLPGLSVKEGQLIYNGQQWDNMSGAEQLRVSTAIVRKLNPNCQFILLDKLEQMDVETMNEFGKWLERENLQCIATRVSTGDECQIIIEDGYVKSDTPQAPQQWQPGTF